MSALGIRRLLIAASRQKRTRFSSSADQLEFNLYFPFWYSSEFKNTYAHLESNAISLDYIFDLITTEYNAFNLSLTNPKSHLTSNCNPLNFSGNFNSSGSFKGYKSSASNNTYTLSLLNTKSSRSSKANSNAYNLSLSSTKSSRSSKADNNAYSLSLVNTKSNLSGNASSIGFVLGTANSFVHKVSNASTFNILLSLVNTVDITSAVDGEGCDNSSPNFDFASYSNTSSANFDMSCASGEGCSNVSENFDFASYVNNSSADFNMSCNS